MQHNSVNQLKTPVASFPLNLHFYTVDFVNCPSNILESCIRNLSRTTKYDQGFDTILAFSITKWVHLTGGDEALKCFFKRIHTLLKPSKLCLYNLAYCVI